MILRRATAVVLAGAALYVAGNLPFGAWWVTLIAVAALATTVRWPVLALAWIAAAIPALDLTPWTGRFYLNEFDAWVVASLAGALWSTPISWSRSLSRIDLTILLLVAASYSLGIWITFTGAALFPEGYWNPYDHPYNALRLAKPVAYAAGTLLLVVSLPAKAGSAATAFAAGSAFGVAVTFAAVALERHRFCGFFATDVDFRPTGPFADMHVGGAYLDAYVVAAIPLLLILLNRYRSLWLGAVGFVLALAAVYSVYATLSRAPVLALTAQCLFLLLAWSVTWVKSRRLNLWAPLGFLVAAAVGGVAVYESPAFRDRFANSVGDWGVRAAHWKASVEAAADTRFSKWFGVGVGRYAYVGRSRVTGSIAKNYQLIQDEGEPFLRLVQSQPLYFAQYVSIKPETDYTLRVTGRAITGPAALSLGIYEKNLLHSEAAVGRRLVFKPSSKGEWSTVAASINSANVGRPVGGERIPALAISRPVVLSFWPNGSPVLDVKKIEIIDMSGNNYVLNSDFSQGADHWWWSADDHLAWHAKNLGAHLLVEQGIIGLGIIALLLVRVFYRVGANLLAGDTSAAALGAALVGLLIVGVFDSVIDSPRTGLLLFVLSILALQRTNVAAPICIADGNASGLFTQAT